MREPGYAVPRERAQRPAVPLWPGAAVGGGDPGNGGLSLGLAETGEPKVSRYVLPPLGLAALTLAWAVLSRVFAGRAQFERGLVMARSGLLAYSLYAAFPRFAAFSPAWRGPAAYEYVAMWGILGAVCYGHLQTLGRSRQVNAAAVAALSLLAIAAQALRQSEARPVLGQQAISTACCRRRCGSPPAAFFAGVEELKSRLDRDRATEPAASPAPQDG